MLWVAWRLNDACHPDFNKQPALEAATLLGDVSVPEAELAGAREALLGVIHYMEWPGCDR